MSAPLVTVGLPTFNRPDSLRSAAESVLAQDYESLELVVSDNASTDATPAVCDELARDPRVRVVRQPENVGAAANFAAVLAEARGELFMWLGDDDRISPTYVSDCARVLAESTEHTLVCGRSVYDDLEEPDLQLPHEAPADRVVAFYRWVGLNGAVYGLMRRADAVRAPIRGTLGGDWLFVAALAFRGTVQTVGTAELTRSLAGESQDVGALAERLGHRGFWARNVHARIALAVFAEVAWRSPAYRTLGPVSRLTLALRCAAAVALRHWAPRVWLRIARRTGLPEKPRLARWAQRRL